MVSTVASEQVGAGFDSHSGAFLKLCLVVLPVSVARRLECVSESTCDPDQD